MIQNEGSTVQDYQQLPQVLTFQESNRGESREPETRAENGKE